MLALLLGRHQPFLLAPSSEGSVYWCLSKRKTSNSVLIVDVWSHKLNPNWKESESNLPVHEWKYSVTLTTICNLLNFCRLDTSHHAFAETNGQILDWAFIMDVCTSSVGIWCLSQFYIQLLYRQHLGTWILPFWQFGQNKKISETTEFLLR